MLHKPMSIGLLCALVMSLSNAVLAVPAPQPPKPKPKTPSGCINVNAKWFLCGSASTTKIVLGGGFRFSEIDPNGRIIASKSYKTCNQLATDATVPTFLRTQASQRCHQYSAPNSTFTIESAPR